MSECVLCGRSINQVLILLILCSIEQLRAEPVSFRNEIAPIIIENCLACHGAKKAEGNYRVESFAKLIAAGDSASAPISPSDPANSELFRRLTTSDPKERMPLDGDPLAAEHVERFRKWIEQGAAFDGTAKDLPLTSIVPPPVHPPAPREYPAPIPIAALAFTPDGSQIVVGGYNELTVWSPSDARLIRRISNIGQRVNAMAFHGDGKTLVVGCGSPGRFGEVRVVDFDSGSIQSVFGITTDCVYDIALSPDGKSIAVAAADSLVRVFELSSGALKRTIASHSDWVNAVAWHSDGSKLATAGRDKTAKVFDVASGELIATYSGHTQAVKAVVFHSDGNEVFSAGGDGQVHRWKIADAKKSAGFTFEREITRLIRSDRQLFATSIDKGAHQLDWESLRPIRSFGSHSDWVLSATYHVPTQQLATGSFDGEVRLWNTSDGKMVAGWKAIPAE